MSRNFPGSYLLSFIAKNIVGAYTSKLHDALIESQSQAVPLADTNFESVRSFQFLQPQGRMAEILEKQVQLLIDAFPDRDGQRPVIPEEGVSPSNDHCADPS